MFDWDMSDDALNSYEQDAKDIHTSARVLRLIKQVRDHRKEIERQATLISKQQAVIEQARFRMGAAYGKMHPFTMELRLANSNMSEAEERDDV